jgi:acyl carrier protein
VWGVDVLELERAVADMGALREIGAEVRDILCFHLGVEAARLTDDTRLHEDLGADSLDVVEIVMSCEERFGVEIPNSAATALTTVGDAIRCVRAEIAAAGPVPGKQPLQAALP